MGMQELKRVDRGERIIKEKRVEKRARGQKRQIRRER